MQNYTSWRFWVTDIPLSQCVYICVVCEGGYNDHSSLLILPYAEEFLEELSSWSKLLLIKTWELKNIFLKIAGELFVVFL